MQFNNFNKNQNNVFIQYEERQKHMIKNFYRDKIKISFMFKIITILREKYGIYDKLLKDFALPHHEIFGLDSILIGICNHITGVHSFNTFLLNEQERVKLHNDEKYIEKLCKTIVEQATFLNCDHENFHKLLAISCGEYLYYPPVYSLYILSKKIGNNFENNYKKSKNQTVEQYNVLRALLVHILNQINVIFSLFEKGYYQYIYPLLRQSIETYVIFLTLKYSNMNVEHYIKFQDYKIFYESNLEFDKEFIDLYEKSHKQCSIQEYLNYGWIDEIIESYYLGTKNKYSIKSLIALVNSLINKKTGKKDYCNDLYVYYQRCHYFTHAKYYEFRFDIVMIMDICKALYEILIGLVEETNFIDDKSNNVDILKYTKDSVMKFHKMRNEIENIDLEKYYKQRGIKK